jgi:hypothetical protein
VLAKDPDWLVSLRALDVLEKLVHDHAAWVEPHRRVFISSLADSDKWEVQIQIVRALPFLTWTSAQRPRVLAVLRRDLEHPQPLVKAWALGSLARLARREATLLPVVRRHLTRFAGSGRPALEARARKIRSLVKRETGQPAQGKAPDVSPRDPCLQALVRAGGARATRY